MVLECCTSDRSSTAKPHLKPTHFIRLILAAFALKRESAILFLFLTCSQLHLLSSVICFPRNCVLSRSDQGQCTSVTPSPKCMATGSVSGAPIYSKSIDRATIIKSKIKNILLSLSFCSLLGDGVYAIKNSLVFFPVPCPEVASDS